MTTLAIWNGEVFYPYRNAKAMLRDLRYLRKRWPGSEAVLQLTIFDSNTFRFTKVKTKTIIL